MKKDKKINVTQAKALYNAYLKGGGIPSTSKNKKEKSQRIVCWSFLILVIALLITTFFGEYFYK
tara:strand:+ start:789 stop:980 length:192 start_codon:yes stop_codon:yes gene_type:complete